MAQWQNAPKKLRFGGKVAKQRRSRPQGPRRSSYPPSVASFAKQNGYSGAGVKAKTDEQVRENAPQKRAAFRRKSEVEDLARRARKRARQPTSDNVRNST